jgi:hypothetical protein
MIGRNTRNNINFIWNPDTVCRIWGSRGGGYEVYSLLGYNVVCYVERQSSLRRTHCLRLQGPISQARYQRGSRWQVFTLVSCWAYLTLKMEAIYSSGTLVVLQRTIYLSLYSPCGTWPRRFFYFLFYTPLVELLGRGINLSQGRYLQREQHKYSINAHRYPCL